MDYEKIKDAFMKDFKELLRRYNANFELEIGDYDAWASIEFNSIYDENHNLVRPYFNSFLPNYIHPDR